MKRLSKAAAGLVCTLFAATATAASDFPTRPITLVVPFAAGGSTDGLARALGTRLSERLGQSVVIDNKPGAAGSIGATFVAKADADGHTLLVATTSTHSILPLLRKLPYDSEKDFSAISGLGIAPNVLVVSPTLGVSSVQDLIALAKRKPGSLSYSSSGTGTITHLIGEHFVQRAGIEATHIPYKTGIQALADLSSGRISFAFDSVVWTLPQSQAGKVQALALATLERSPLAPSLPTLSESGLPSFVGTTWFGIMGPAGIPAPVIEKLNQSINQVLAEPDMQKQLHNIGAIPLGGSPDKLRQLIRDEMKQWQPVIEQAKISMEQ